MFFRSRRAESSSRDLLMGFSGGFTASDVSREIRRNFATIGPSSRVSGFGRVPSRGWPVLFLPLPPALLACTSSAVVARPFPGSLPPASPLLFEGRWGLALGRILGSEADLGMRLFFRGIRTVH